MRPRLGLAAALFVISSLLGPAGAEAAAPHAEGIEFGATAGTPYSGEVAHFNSRRQPRSMPADFAVEIDWGDATGGSEGTVTCADCTASVPLFNVSGSHTYAATGLYQVTVTIHDQVEGSEGAATSTAIVAAGPPPPGPSVDLASTSSASPGQFVRFDGSAAVPGADDYRWDFDGDGAYETSCGANPIVHQAFDAPGTYMIGLQATSGAGVSTFTDAVAVTDPGPVPGPKKKPSGFHLPAGTLSAAPASSVAAPGPINFCAPLELAQQECEGTRKPVVTFGIGEAVATKKSGFCRQTEFVGEGPKSVKRTVWVTDDPIRLNGLDIRPYPGTLIKILPDSRTIRSEQGGDKVEVTLAAPAAFGGSLPIYKGPLSWKLPAKGRLGLKDFDFGSAYRLLGFPLTGHAGLALTMRAAEIPVHVRLPGIFSKPGGGGVTADITLGANNYEGLHLDGLSIIVPQVFLGGLQVEDVSVLYRRVDNIWQGGAKITFPTGHSLDARPPRPQGFGLRNGQFDYAGATLNFPSPGLPVFSGVYLNKVGFAISTHPTALQGTATLTAGRAVGRTLARLDGDLYLGFGTPAEPVVLAGGRKFTTTTLRVGGTLVLMDSIQLASASAIYSYPAYFEFAGNMNFSVIDGLISIKANVGGWADLKVGLFNMEAGAALCVKVVGCVGGDFVLSSRGVGGCARTPILDIGGGIWWSGGFNFMWRSCDAGKFREVLPAAGASARSAAAGRTLRIPAGQRAAIIGAVGKTTAPDVTLIGPNGERISTPDDPAQGINNQTRLVFRAPEVKTAFFVIRHPSPGRWRVETKPGSDPIAAVRQGEALPEPSVRAGVRGRGRERMLTYAVKQIPGQRVIFAEKGPQTGRVIGVARGERGTLRFSPADGPGGRRKIVAVVESYGRERESLDVATYRAPAMIRPARPRHVSLHRRGSKLLVRWSAATHSARYAVGVDISDGRRLMLVSAKNRRWVRVAGVGRRERATVHVVGLRADGVAGPARKARLRAR